MYLNWFAVADHVLLAFISFYGIIIPWLVVNFVVRSLDLEITSGRPFCFSCLLPGKIASKQPETTLHLQRAFFFILSFISYCHTSLTLLQGQNLVTSPFILKMTMLLIKFWSFYGRRSFIFFIVSSVERIINCYLASCRWKNSLLFKIKKSKLKKWKYNWIYLWHTYSIYLLTFKNKFISLSHLVLFLKAFLYQHILFLFKKSNRLFFVVRNVTNICIQFINNKDSNFWQHMAKVILSIQVLLFILFLWPDCFSWVKHSPLLVTIPYDNAMLYNKRNLIETCYFSFWFFKAVVDSVFGVVINNILCSVHIALCTYSLSCATDISTVNVNKTAFLSLF